MVKRIKQDSQLLEFLESNLKVTMISMVMYTEKVSACISRWRIPVEKWKPYKRPK